jgi:hypothetical protein
MHGDRGNVLMRLRELFLEYIEGATTTLVGRLIAEGHAGRVFDHADDVDVEVRPLRGPRFIDQEARQRWEVWRGMVNNFDKVLVRKEKQATRMGFRSPDLALATSAYAVPNPYIEEREKQIAHYKAFLESVGVEATDVWGEKFRPDAAKAPKPNGRPPTTDVAVRSALVEAAGREPNRLWSGTALVTAAHVNKSRGLEQLGVLVDRRQLSKEGTARRPRYRSNRVVRKEKP